MRKRIIMALALASVATSATAQNLIVNGGFEAGPRDPSGVLNVPAGSNLIPGWKVLGAGVDVVSTPLWSGSNGSAASIDLSLLAPGSISQGVRTGFSFEYRLSFDISASPDVNPPTKPMAVTVANGAQNVVRNYSPAASGVTNQVTWTTQTIDFKSFAETSVISFASQTNSPFGPNVDNVILQPLGIWSRTFHMFGRNTGVQISFKAPEVVPPPPPPPPPIVTVPERPRLRISPKIITVVEPAGPIVPPDPRIEAFFDVFTDVVTFGLGKGTKTPKGFAKSTSAGGLSSFSAGSLADDPDGYETLIEFSGSAAFDQFDGGMIWKENFTTEGSYIGASDILYSDTFDVVSTLSLEPLNAFAVPEPSSWTMLIAGFGLTGAAMRRRRTSVAAA